MTYVKIFLDTAGGVEMLSDEERGRLFLAILRYAGDGELPELTGNERFLWETFKWQLDRSQDKYQRKVKEGGSGGGKRASRKLPPSVSDYAALMEPLP